MSADELIALLRRFPDPNDPDYNGMDDKAWQAHVKNWYKDVKEILEGVIYVT